MRYRVRHFVSSWEIPIAVVFFAVVGLLAFEGGHMTRAVSLRVCLFAGVAVVAWMLGRPTLPDETRRRLLLSLVALQVGAMVLA